MLVKTRLLIFSIFIIFISLTAVCASDNSTFDEISTPNQDYDELEVVEEPVLSDNPGTFDELAELIQGSGDVINLQKDYKYVSGDSVSGDGIAINRPMTINGNGHSIDASNSVRIFFVNSSDVILNNISFVNGSSAQNGGAILSNGDNLVINNSNFKENHAYIGGSFYSTGTKTIIDNCNFTDNSATRTAGAGYLRGSDSVVNNTVFDNNVAEEFNGGALSIYGTRTIVENCNFTDSEAYNCGGALAWSGTYGTVRNSNFNNSEAGAGGSIFFFGDATRATVDNCNFSNDYCHAWGGSIYFYASYGTLTNSRFTSNYAVTAGGAVYADDYRMVVDNCVFENNGARLGGGALTIFGSSSSVTNSNFTSNYANSHGGSIYAQTYSSNFENLTIVNSSAASGGGMYFVYNERDTNAYSYSTLTNSRFINNTARYGGGALTLTDHSTVSKCNFSGNSSNSYGGAIDATNSILRDLIIEDSSSFYGGAIYAYNSDIINVTLRNNIAEIANEIYVLNRSNIIDTPVSDDDMIIYGNDSRGRVLGSRDIDHAIDHLMSTDSGYFAYCAERYNLSPYTGIYDNSMEKLKNSINNELVSDYLKILIYHYVDHMDDLRNNDFHEYVWAFTDFEYWNSTDPIVSEVRNLFDSGFRVPTNNACKVLANGTLMYFNFSSMITPSGQQNLFLFKFWQGKEINETLTKEALNKTAFIGDTVEYRIVVSNKGTSPIYDLWIEDKDYSKGLKYESWRPEIGNWRYDNKTEHWILDELGPAKSASLILFFRVLVNGTLYNNATSGLGTINVTNATDEIRVYNPDFTVQKITLTEKVKLGEQVRFEIVVRNTGDINLTNVTVVEESYDGLVFDHAEQTALWSEFTVGGKHTWRLNDVLAIGDVARFIVVFNTTGYGNFTNVVVASSNETGNKTGNNTTKVLKPGMKVVKRTITPRVVIGEKSIFEIIVTNTGETDLEKVFVRESKYDSGLVYLDYISKNGNWKYSLDGDGKPRFTLTGLLKVGDSASFRVIFNTTRIGNFSNTVEAGYDNTTVSNSTNTTEVVNKTVPKDPKDIDKNKTRKNKVPVDRKTLKCVNPKLDEKATGNPLIVLLLALIILPLRRFLK